MAHGWAPYAPPNPRRPGSSGGGGGGGSNGAGSRGGSRGGSAAALADAPPDEVAQPYPLRDAYASRPLPYTRRVPRLASELDGLWAPAAARVEALLDARQPGDAGGMPNERQPSDHLPLGAVLLLPCSA